MYVLNKILLTLLNTFMLTTNTYQGMEYKFITYH